MWKKRQRDFGTLLTCMFQQETKHGSVYSIFRSESGLSVLLAALKACTTSRDLDTGKVIHSTLAKTCEDWRNNHLVSNSLINLYSKCSRPHDAHRVFNIVRHPDVVSWTSLILGYVEAGQPDTALNLFSLMQTGDKACVPDARTYVAAIKACTSMAEEQTDKAVFLELGERIYAEAVSQGDGGNIYVQNTVVDMYSKCGKMVDARRMFDRMTDHDVVSWNALMLGYVEVGEAEQALILFSRMRVESRQSPDARTFLIALKACSELAETELGVQVGGATVKAASLQRCMELHSEAARRNGRCDSEDIFLANTLVTLYSKCGSMMDARRVFDRVKKHDVVSWNALMLGYAENGEEELALKLFLDHMVCERNALSFVPALKACACLALKEEEEQVDKKPFKVESLRRAVQVHSLATKHGHELDIFVSSTLVDLYTKCGSLKDAQEVFDRMWNRNVVSWNSLMLGYAQNSEEDEALNLYTRMKASSGPPPNALTYAAALQASGSLASLDVSKAIHADVCRAGLEMDELVTTALVGTYGKCSGMVESDHVFASVLNRNTVTRNALMSGCSRHGDTARVFELFHGMIEEGLQVNAASFVAILTACSHAGLVDTGNLYFAEMLPRYGIPPGPDHYHCLVDMLSRDNRLDEALRVVATMPFKANVVTWTMILSSCRKWKNAELGRIAFESIQRLDQGRNSSASLLMAGCREQTAEVL